MNWGWHRQKEVLKTDKATQAESRLAAIKKVRASGEEKDGIDKQRRDCYAKQKRRYVLAARESLRHRQQHIRDVIPLEQTPSVYVHVRIQQGMHHARAGSVSVENSVGATVLFHSETLQG